MNSHSDVIFCPFRRVRKGRSHCIIADDKARNTTKRITREVCKQCGVPKLYADHPCENLTFGVIISNTDRGFRISNVFFNCFCYEISSTANCNSSCQYWKPIIEHPENNVAHQIIENTENMSDSDLRQAILIVLYKYYIAKPERFKHFDVNPEYLAKAVGVSIKDIVRVIFPMEEAGEVKLLKRPVDTFFQGSTITSKGIERIDNSPLFGKLSTKEVRIMANFNVSNSTIIGSFNESFNRVKQKITNIEKKGIADVANLIERLADEINAAEELPIERKQEAISDIEKIGEEITKDKPDKNILEASISRIKKLIEPLSTAVNIGEIIEKIWTALGNIL